MSESRNRTAAPAAGEFKDACRRRSIPPKVFSVGWYGSDTVIVVVVAGS